MKILDQQEKTAKKLLDEGYEVYHQVTGASGSLYDLVAQRDGRGIVFEFKNQAQLGTDANDISRLRQAARQDGYSDFRLVVVPEEKTISIQIMGLDTTLLSWLTSHPESKADTILSEADVVFRRVDQVQITSLASESGRSGTRVQGAAVVEFMVFAAGKAMQDEIWDCPLYFDVHLNANWQVESIGKLALDLASNEDDLKEHLKRSP